MIDPIHLATMWPWLALGATAQTIGACGCRERPHVPPPVVGEPFEAPPPDETPPTRACPYKRVRPGIWAILTAGGALVVVAAARVSANYDPRTRITRFSLFDSRGYEIGKVE